MKTMKKVLLVFDSNEELDFIAANLADNGFQSTGTSNLADALVMAEKMIPDLIVVNTADTEEALQKFSSQVKTERLKEVSILSLTELEDYLHLANAHHFVIRRLRPKLLLSVIRNIMNHETISWLPAVH